MNLFMSGGWILGAIFALSLLAWSLIMNRLMLLRSETRINRKWEQSIFASMKQNDTETTAALCSRHPGATARIIGESLNMYKAGIAVTRKRASELLRREAVYLRRNFELIAVIGAVLPLLGLLGTILGITHTFNALTLGPGTETSAAMAGGISQALITTQAGLVTALPIVLVHGWMSSRVRFCVDESRRIIKKAETLLRSEKKHV
ncbi:MAG: MotA/TolQ/ExbB proton channel family protein [Verrucomicrobiota bacterium]